MGWQVQLVGDPTDLRMLADSLRDPPMTVSEENGEFFLRCSGFDGITDDGEVRARADEIVMSLSSLSHLVLGSVQPIRVGVIKGPTGIYVLVGTAEERDRALPIGYTKGRADGTVETYRPADPIRDWIPLAAKDPAVAKALRLRNADRLRWVELYRLYEVIEADAGGPPNIIQREWASASELDRFKHTANSVSAAGDEARHGREDIQPPKDPMNLPEASDLVDRILQSWLRSRAEAD